MRREQAPPGLGATKAFGQALILSLAQWQAHAERLEAAGATLGICLEPSDDPGQIVHCFERIVLIAIRFPAFTDGRGYSTARLLRQRHGWTGELRAVGDVLRDQMFYLSRCGFDTFDLKDGEPVAEAIAGFGDFSEAYQSAADRGPLFRRRSARHRCLGRPVSAGLAAASAAQPPARVVLVGAGPGSVDLLTLKAARLIAEADWLVHDALVQPEVLALAARAVIIGVGKRAGRKSTRQGDINRTLIDCARRGGLVVRLKGGDPLMFARAQEELEALRAAGIVVEVVPGITTAQAAHAAIAAPMTERGRRRSMVFATPQVQAPAAGPVVDESSGESIAEPIGAADGGADVQWARALVNAGGGALYMASSVVNRARATLLSLGMAADTPATWVINVSLPGQAVLATTVGELGPLPQEHSGKPALLLLGTGVASALPPAASARQSSRVVAQSVREPATATLSS